MAFIFRIMHGQTDTDADSVRAPADRQKALQELDRIRARDLVLPEWLRSTPCWDILFYLFANPTEYGGLPIRELARGVGLSEDAGRRWINAMAEERLISLSDTPFGQSVTLKVATKCNIQFYLDYVESAMSSRRRTWSTARKST